VATLAVDAAAVVRAVRHQASFLVATTVLDLTQRSDQELIHTDKDQHRVERGCSFLTDPLLLASSVFVKQPARIVARARVMVRCLLVYRLAEHRLRAQLAATGQTIPRQLNQPTARPTMRWVFPCFEGIDLLHLRAGPSPAMALVLRVQPVHQQVLALLGPAYEAFYKPTN
jgi:transposase